MVRVQTEEELNILQDLVGIMSRFSSTHGSNICQ